MSDSPPRPKKAAPADLAEVERALSVLQGRHPEHERARREDAESRQRRAAELDSYALHENRRARARNLRIAAVVVPVVALFGFIGFFGRREMGRRARIDAVSASFAAQGFTPIETSLRGSTDAIETAAEPGCFLAVSTSDQPVTITRGSVRTPAAPPALFCTCVQERIGVTSPVGDSGGIALLRADTARVGGSRAFPYLTFKPATALAVDDACSEASLDAWIDAKHYPHAPFDDAWFKASPRRAALAGADFHVIGSSRAELPLVVVDVPKESCVLVTSDVADDRLRVRIKGDPVTVVEGRGTVARCAQAEATLVVTREGHGNVTALAAPAKLGGVLGLRELVRGAGMSAPTIVVPASDRAWDAKQILVASAVPDALITIGSAPDVMPDPEARLVTLSLETANALTFDVAADVQAVCAPPLDPATGEAFCAFSGAQKWRSPGTGEGAIGGLARSKLPSWLYSMQGVKDRAALTGIMKLLALARLLGRDGFVPTTLEALVERANGVEVLGRTGEDAVVAVGVAPSEPWVYSLTDDSDWSLDGPPQIALVKPLETVTLVSFLKKLPPLATRRTVVFRRQKK